MTDQGPNGNKKGGGACCQQRTNGLALGWDSLQPERRLNAAEKELIPAYQGLIPGYQGLIPRKSP